MGERDENRNTSGEAILLRHEDLFGVRGFHIAETVLAMEGPSFLHTHDFYEIFLVTEGRLIHQVNGREVPMARDSLGLVLPEDVHCYRRTGSTPARLINVAFPGPLFALAANAHAIFTDTDSGEVRAFRHTTNLPSPLTQALLLRLGYLTSHAGRAFHVDDQQLLAGILMDCLTLLRGAGEEPTAPHWLSHACEAVRQNRRFTSGIGELVALSGKSQAHVTREMRRFYGTTPSAYINSLRLDYAAHLLNTTDDSVLDILLACGFGNASHFNAQFKQMFGVTPSRYRRINSQVVSPYLSSVK